MRPRWQLSFCVGGLMALAVILAGCGGHDGSVTPGDGVAPASRAFVGRDVCGTCHSGINNAYSGSAHGQDFTQHPAGNLITRSGGACQPCHTVGYGEPTGFTSPTATPHLAGIGCEECHGPGSLHASAPSSANIDKIPDARTTCWDCHAAEYKLVRNEFDKVITDEDLRNTVPRSVHVYHSQATMLLGTLGYNHPPQPGAHSRVVNTCVYCHLWPDEEDVFSAQARPRRHGATGLEPDYGACVVCHGSAEAAQALAEEEAEEVKAKLIQIGGANPSDPSEPDETGSGGLLAAFAARHGIDINSNANPDDPFVKRYKGARSNFSYLNNAGCFVHNPNFAKDLADETIRLLTD